MDSGARFPLSQLTLRIRIGIAAFCGLIAFAPSAIAMLRDWTSVSLANVAVLVIALALWTCGWFSRRLRPALLTGSLALMLAGIVLLPPTSAFIWPRLASVALALAITAAAMTNVPVTAVLTAGALTLLFIDSERALPLAGHLSSTTLGKVATALGILMIAPAMAYVSQLWSRRCSELDLAANASREREAQALSAERAESARAAVDRRIHETVLNTLAAVSRAEMSPSAAQAQCASDLHDLDSLSSGAPRGVQDMLAALLTKNQVPGPILGVIHSDVAFRDDDVAQVAFDALNEVLRNVIRHARATRTSIRAVATSQAITFTVEDDGVGMDDSTRARFGLRRALADSVQAVGGTVAVTSGAERGTRVTITIPLSSPRSTPPSREAALDLLLGPLGARLAMLPALAIGLVLLIPTGLVFTTSIAVMLCYALFAGFVIAVSLRWTSGRLALLSAASLAFLLATQAAAWWGLRDCSSASGLHVIAFATAGAMVLPALSLRSLRTTWLFITAFSVPTLLLPWALPSDCRPEALVPSAETITWVVALVGIIALLARAVDRSDRELDQRWREATLADARRQALHAADERWRRSVNSETREFLSGVASGAASPASADVRAAAVRLESRLRSLLETSRIPGEGMRTFLDGVVERASAAGAAVSVTVIDGREDPQPPEDVCATLVAVAEHPETRAMSITLLERELLVASDRTALSASGCRDLGDTEDPTTAVAVITWSREEDPAGPS